MSVRVVGERIVAMWTVPGIRLLVCDREKTGLFCAFIRRKQASRMVQWPTQSGEVAAFQATLSQGFLGNAEVLWCDLSLGSKKPAKWTHEVMRSLQGYQGPHAVWMVCDAEMAEQLPAAWMRIQIPDVVMGSEMGDLATFCDLPRARDVLAHGMMRISDDQMSVDEALVLLRHAEYVPTKEWAAADEYLQKFLPVHASLQMLSELFFKQDYAAFFAYWAQIGDQYGEMFWVAFWSEQLWRAYWVCFFMNKGQQTRARAVSFRLPPAFLGGLWRRQDREMLRNGYEQLFFFDCCVKKGGLFALHELWTASIGMSR